jgi:uncharacterized protein YhfF
MRANFPVVIQAIFCGQAGNSGSFVDEDGNTVAYTEAFAFDFDDSEGNVNRLVMRGQKFNECADGFSIAELQRYQDAVEIVGNAVVDDSRAAPRSFFRPTRIRRVQRGKGS